jgi:hypothetical protein
MSSFAPPPLSGWSIHCEPARGAMHECLLVASFGLTATFFADSSEGESKLPALERELQSELHIAGTPGARHFAVVCIIRIVAGASIRSITGTGGFDRIPLWVIEGVKGLDA